jgi:hypothetical protein
MRLNARQQIVSHLVQVAFGKQILSVAEISAHALFTCVTGVLLA